MWWVLISIAAVLVIAWLTYDGGSLDYRQREADAAAADIGRRRRHEAAHSKAVVGDPRPERTKIRVAQPHLPVIRPAAIYR
ncbi:hypothetical protein [Gordonia sp. (in: high G+C Gram-positive bacteria)]|jgi:hypothetical protein|uniref:hypothetical protein n=1 Tax=Gordonia sp. (in: high G+C Gram-positive bacteria) TaxID=84139 RepID=UPI001D448DF5|nr:hypothetical protein [Gordonia sp. (in: high G+C Gram-positive bacteria)]MCB1294064.1 hypothetical protein [Gordonia sp. (in: high G+C Gram-positive bacteria)]HMS76050.1 hypothetical protein [Gordonia sp. (in: high G+C Gram-positive bacteria)]HQV16875.1 hypothetical protein [Gordonia sp. (in: high G+C Gram-positive bacteria)]